MKSGVKHHKPTKPFYARTGSKNTNVLHLTHHWCYKNLEIPAPMFMGCAWALRSKTPFEEPQEMGIQNIIALTEVYCIWSSGALNEWNAFTTLEL